MSTPSIACIVLNWNGGERILRCIRSLYASSNITPQVVVVDNGSSDGSLELIQRQYPDVQLIGFEENAGLVLARNTGIRRALEQSFSFVLFIDDDAVVEKDCLHRLFSVLENTPSAGIATPRIFDGSDVEMIWYDGGVTNIFGDTLHRNMGKRKGETESNTPLTISFATGCCVMVKREVFEKVGLLDESYFVYSEDADFSFRARAAGYSIMHIPQAEALHDQSGDTKANKGKWFRDYYVVRNKLMLFQRHYAGIKKVFAVLSFSIAGILAPIVYHTINGEWSRYKAIRAGVVDSLRGRSGKRYS